MNPFYVKLFSKVGGSMLKISDICVFYKQNLVLVCRAQTIHVFPAALKLICKLILKSRHAKYFTVLLNKYSMVILLY